ncbi:MAG: 7TM diverse intracellular signaling domain-containing protein [Gammaproteobacteria bacterium]
MRSGSWFSALRCLWLVSWFASWAVVGGVFAGASAGEARAASLTVEDGRHDYPVGEAMAWLQDDSAALDIDVVSSPRYEDQFRPAGADQLNVGFTRSVLWVRLSVDFGAGAGRNWHLVEGNAMLDELTLYVPAGENGWQRMPLGDTLSFAERPYSLRDFVFPLPPPVTAGDGPVTFYLRVAGQGALNLAPRLMDAQALAEHASHQQWGFGLFYGAMGILLVYNLFLYLAARERTQLDYCIWLGGFTLLFVSLNGIGLQYLWPRLPAINGFFPLFAGVAILGALQFTRRFLDLSQASPRLDVSFLWLGRGVMVLLVAGLLLPRQWFYILGNLMPLLFAVLMLVVGIRRLREGYRPARLFVAGWGVLLVGAILLPLASLGLLPMNTLTMYSPQFGAVLQGVLLSLALGDRLRLLKHENERLQAESREKLEGMFRQLAGQDADKLRFLQYLSRELNAPVDWSGAGRTGGDAGKNAVVEAADASRQRLMDLMDTVLRYFRVAGEDPGSVPSAPVAPMWLVDDLLRERRAEIDSRRLRVRNRVPAELVVMAAERRLRRILDGLLDNATNHSEDGGEIEITGGIQDNGRAGWITVRDQGAGIDADRQASLFEPFFTGAARSAGRGNGRGGFGLSLPIAGRMVANMGGELRVHSAGRGRGAALTVILPAAGGASSQEFRTQSPVA